MKKIVSWQTVMTAARAAAAKLPPPAPVEALAEGIARNYVAQGYEVEGYDAKELQPADIPNGEAGLDARMRAVARSRGLDRRGIADRRGAAPAGTLESIALPPRPREAAVEAPAAAKPRRKHEAAVESPAAAKPRRKREASVDVAAHAPSKSPRRR